MSDILKFCELVLEKEKNDSVRELKRSDLSPLERNQLLALYPSITLSVIAHKNDGAIPVGPFAHHIVLKLDEDDMWYLYEKYSKKLKEEYDAKLADLNEQYKEVVDGTVGEESQGKNSKVF